MAFLKIKKHDSDFSFSIDYPLILNHISEIKYIDLRFKVI
jgi:hypothetical protein